jgi:hypothetical protein
MSSNAVRRATWDPQGVGRLTDFLLAWLTHPRVRPVRRWSFVITVPAALAVAHVYGVHQGAWVVAARVLLWVALAVAARRVGGERGEALRDLIVHPRLRAWTRAEADVLTVLPRLLVARVRGRPPAGTSYARGAFGLALALAFTPAVVAEGAALHLLLGGSWVAWAVSAAHLYALVWLWGAALGPRAFPHRVGPRAAVLRAGSLYRVLVPREALAAACVRRERVGGDDRWLVEREEAVLLPVRGRVDVWLELSAPVRVQRPLHEPLETRRLAVASDDPEALVRLLLAPVPPCRAPVRGKAAGLLVGLDLAGLARDAAHPA